MRLLVVFAAFAAVMPSIAAFAQDVATKEPSKDDMICQLDPGACPIHRGIQATPPGQELQPNTINLTVNFENNSAVLETDALINLDRLGTALSDPRLQGKKFRIGGHTDAKGNDRRNLILSERRAEMVRKYLIHKYKIPANSLVATGYGRTKPLDPKDPDSPVNRRVEVINLTPTPPRQ
jgi:outer membrane protein OmpA-like peptidoglycan-associated protein